MGLLSEVVDLSKELENAKQRALNVLAKECSKYQNKRITYISKKPRIFTIKFSDLQNTWCPEYYDFEFQFKVIIYVLRHTNSDNLVNKWNTLKEKGIAKWQPSIIKEYKLSEKFAEINEDLKRDWYPSNYTVLKFHPDVVKFVDELLM